MVQITLKYVYLCLLIIDDNTCIVYMAALFFSAHRLQWGVGRAKEGMVGGVEMRGWVLEEHGGRDKGIRRLLANSLK